jgi:hypothetical protein
MAKLVWGFNFLPPIDPQTGEPAPLNKIDTDVPTAYTDGVSTGPKKFDCRIVPRSQDHVDVMKRDFVEAQSIFSQYS